MECEPDSVVEALWSRRASSFQPAGSGGGKGLQSGGELSFLLSVLKYFNIYTDIPMFEKVNRLFN